MKNFTTDLQRGQAGEAQLDAFFGKYWAIQPATMTQQRQGIDRSYYDLHTSEFKFTVEYKFDSMAGKTGNAFIELASCGVTLRQGWAYTCTADRLFYCVADDALVYVINPVQLRAFLPGWLRKYGKSLKGVANQVGGSYYSTVGVLVPLRELEQISEQTVSM